MIDPYPSEANFPAGQRHHVAVGAHGNQAHVRDAAAAPVLVLGLHAEGRQGLVVAAQLHHRVQARAHHVIAAAIEGGVMGVTLGAAGGRGVRQAPGLPIQHLAELLGTALLAFAGGLPLGQQGWGGKRGGHKERVRSVHPTRNPGALPPGGVWAVSSQLPILEVGGLRSGISEGESCSGLTSLRVSGSPENTAQPRRTGRW